MLITIVLLVCVIARVVAIGSGRVNGEVTWDNWGDREAVDSVIPHIRYNFAFNSVSYLHGTWFVIPFID